MVDRELTSAPPDPQAVESEFKAFFGTVYRSVVASTMYVGATKPEAEDAAAQAMLEVLGRWHEIDHPTAYARRAAVTNFMKAKERSLDRIRRRQVERRAGTPEGRPDDGLTVWEDRQWVLQLLNALPAKQREVMALMVDGFSPAEISALLGRTPDAVRQTLHDARQRLKTALDHEAQGQQEARPRAGSARKEAR